ncbi:hypothetical protein LZ023_37070 (plasmid) [Pseudomonas silvicola]|nr:hypothetical protein LZ023_37070 [Pseudomonas silvicola]
MAIYRLGKFVKGTAEQGPQSPLTPAQRYRLGIAALDKALQQHYGRLHYVVIWSRSGADRNGAGQPRSGEEVETKCSL